MSQLDSRILKFLAKKLTLSENTVRKNISLLAHRYPNVTPNARAQIYAQMHKKTVWGKLSKEDRQSLPNIEIQKGKTIITQKNNKLRKVRIIQLLKYKTTDPFRNGHIEEINRAYTYKCYTSVFILCRKVVENMIIDILRIKFPENNKQNKELYFDTAQSRFKDFSIILKNFKARASDFGTDKKLVERIYDLAIPLKDKANDKAHSWFHLVRKPREIEDLDMQNLIDLITRLESSFGI